jgi:hypothetical protein
MRLTTRSRLSALLVALLAALGVAALVAYAWVTPEPAGTALRLVAGVCGAGPAQGAALARDHLADVVVLVAGRQGQGEPEQRLSPAEALALVADLRLGAPQCSLSLVDWQTAPGAAGTVWVSGALEFSQSQAGDLHARRRAVRGLFRMSTGEPRLQRLELGPAERTLPEARP